MLSAAPKGGLDSVGIPEALLSARNSFGRFALYVAV